MAPRFPRRRVDVRLREVDGEMVVVDRREGLVHQLNQTARFVWMRCDGRTALAEIAWQLAREFDVDAPTATRDTALVIDRFRELGLLEPKEEHDDAQAID